MKRHRDNLTTEREKPGGVNFESHASKRVSFVLTTKNQAENLQKTLESHRTLIHSDDELLIIDGLSTDHTAKVVKQYADMVDIFISEPDISSMDALNKGILGSRGKYIKHLTDDDVIYPEATEQAIQVLDEHPEIDLLVCGGTKQKGDNTYPVWLPPGTNYGSSVEDGFKYGTCGVGFVVRRSAFSRIGLFHPTNVAADREFVVRAIKQGASVKFCRINLFNHPIFDQSFHIIHGQESKSDDRSLVKRYCSKRFYYRYLLAHSFRKYGLYYMILRPLNITAFLRNDGFTGALRRIFKLFRRKGEPILSKKDKDYIWDGGFS
jgi:glycosyltransferase involved in cell wall biosynthesis